MRQRFLLRISMLQSIFFHFVIIFSITFYNAFNFWAFKSLLVFTIYLNSAIKFFYFVISASLEAICASFDLF